MNLKRYWKSKKVCKKKPKGLKKIQIIQTISCNDEMKNQNTTRKTTTTTNFLSLLLLHINWSMLLLLYTNYYIQPPTPNPSHLFPTKTPVFFTFWVKSCENVLVTNDICPMWFFLSISTNEMLKYKPELKYQIFESAWHKNC